MLRSSAASRGMEEGAREGKGKGAAMMSLSWTRCSRHVLTLRRCCRRDRPRSRGQGPCPGEGGPGWRPGLWEVATAVVVVAPASASVQRKAWAQHWQQQQEEEQEEEEEEEED